MSETNDDNVIGTCEGCDKDILDGEVCQRDEDGICLCGACIPPADEWNVWLVNDDTYVVAATEEEALEYDSDAPDDESYAVSADDHRYYDDPYNRADSAWRSMREQAVLRIEAGEKVPFNLAVSCHSL